MSRSRIRHLTTKPLPGRRQRSPRRRRPEDERAIVVPGDDVQLAPSRADAPDVARLTRHQEAALCRPYGSEIPLSIAVRSEEHTSELQSLAYLVCRLLLEKKKQIMNAIKHQN